MLEAVNQDLGGGNVGGNRHVVHIADAQQIHFVRLAGLGADGVAEEKQHIHFLTGDARHNLLCAAVAAGADGLIIEVHNDPPHALCDGPQSIRPQAFEVLAGKLKAISDVMKGDVK